MSKTQSKQMSSYEREERARHYFKQQKTFQDRKMMKDLDREIRNNYARARTTSDWMDDNANIHIPE